jgi:hypothetical protein
LARVSWTNPRNPTGILPCEGELQSYLRTTGCTLLLDEFQSKYVYGTDGSSGTGSIFAALHLDRVTAEFYVGATNARRSSGGSAAARLQLLPRLG